MVDENKPTDKPTVNSGRNAKKDVDLFPVVNDRKAGTLSSLRTPPSKIGTQISIFAPNTFEEALDIVECLRGRAATTISLENMKKVDANRLVDFVAGASAALDGDFHKLSEQVYIFCPSNIKITAPGKETDKAPFTMAMGASTSTALGGVGALDFLYPTTTQYDGSSSSTWSTIH
ncbi:MAG TPA: cell division protein SepF [Drouetiella sp.]